jgi:hypothetical protein
MLIIFKKIGKIFKIAEKKIKVYFIINTQKCMS